MVRELCQSIVTGSLTQKSAKRRCKININLICPLTYYRLLDKYGKPISALAIYTDENRKYHPKKYNNSHWGTEVSYSFNSYKLLEKEAQEFDRLPENPFSIVMKAAWITLKKGKKVKLLDMKLDLARQLLKKGYGKNKTKKVLNFIAHYVDLKKPKEKLIFDKEIEVLIKPRKNMGILEGIREELKRQAIEQGLEQGLEQGKLQATYEFQTQTILRGLELNLDRTTLAILLGVEKTELPSLIENLSQLGYLDDAQVKKLKEKFG